MSKKKLVIKDRDREIEDTITVETATHEIELPALEGREVIKAFVDELIDSIDEEYRSKGKKMNATAQIIQNSDLLDDEDETEVLAHNKKYKGEVDALEGVGSLLYSALTDFTSDDKSEVFVDE